MHKVVVATIFGSTIVILMLLWVMTMEPPYAFVMIMRPCVIAASVVGSIIIARISYWLLPLSVLLVAVAITHAFLRMSRQQWLVYDSGSIAVFVVLILVLLASIAKKS